VQAFINDRQAPLRFRLVVQRTAVDLIGPETIPNSPELDVLPVPPLPPLPGAAEQSRLGIPSPSPRSLTATFS